MNYQWTYQGNPVDQLPEGCIGFVYLITNTTNNKKYIGKKLGQFKKTKPPLKGKKRKRRTTVESDWRTYSGSSEHLNEDIKNLGEEKFTREILHFCTTRGQLSYLEAKEQFDREARTFQRMHSQEKGSMCALGMLFMFSKSSIDPDFQ